MGTSAVNLEKHSLALLAAKGDVASGRAAASWALFAYEKSNELKLLDSGAGGPDELARRFQIGSVMYGLCRLPDAVGEPLVVLINWVGEKVSEPRRKACAAHLPAIRAFFKEARLVVSAGCAEEVTQEGLRHRLALHAAPGGAAPKKAPFGDPQELVGTNYQKTNPALEILRTKRDSFWAQAEREEEERREEERRRAQEERRRWERQRMEEERRQTAERERRLQEREQLLQERRKQQAQLEDEARWQQEGQKVQLGHDPPRQSGQTATEAAGQASPHSGTARTSFQQRGRSASTSGSPEPPSPSGARPGTPRRRPFLRYQRSLTESAFIFRRPDLPAAFLPSAAPLPSPQRSKPAPPTSPKPPAGSPSHGAVPGRSSPPGTPPLLPEPPQAPAALRSPEPGPLHPIPPELAPLEAGPTYVNGHVASPRRASAPPLSSPPLPNSAEAGPVPQTDLPWHDAAPVSSPRGTGAPLAPLHEEALPASDSSGLTPTFDNLVSPVPHGKTAAEEPEECGGASGSLAVVPPRDASPSLGATGEVPAPGPSQAESALQSGAGCEAAEEESWAAMSRRLCALMPTHTRTKDRGSLEQVPENSTRSRLPPAPSCLPPRPQGLPGPERCCPAPSEEPPSPCP